ncbi:MAG: PHP domain-containing protein [Candidatus Thorarchaeota archaeon]|jgi:predicted metal-dependent phosphoesterase TrpH
MNERLSAFDLHMHTIHSKDGLNDPRKLFTHMKKKGLRGMAVTEHFYPSLTKPVQRNGRFLLPACEFKSSDYGEVIGLFISEPVENRTFAEIADGIREQNGLVVLPHPRDPLRKQTAIRRGLSDNDIRKHVDLVEGINSRCILPIFNKWAQSLAARLDKPMTAGSDGHSYWELGHGKTWLQDIENVDDIYGELRRGRTQISGYPSFFIWHFPSMIWQRARKIAYDKW